MTVYVRPAALSFPTQPPPYAPAEMPLDLIKMLPRAPVANGLERHTIRPHAQAFRELPVHAGGSSSKQSAK